MTIRPALPPPSDDDLRWVLRFAAMELESITPGALYDVTQDIRTFMRGHGEPGQFSLRLRLDRSADYNDQMNYTLEAVRRLQLQLRDALDALRLGKPWPLPAGTRVGSSRLVPEGPLIPGNPTPRIRRELVDFELDVVFPFVVADVLLTRWSEIRVCASPTCHRLFVPDDGRQKYHDPRCRQQALWAKFAPTRTRNFHTEYKKRVKRQLGSRVTVQPRPRRSKTRSTTGGHRG